MKRTLSLFLCFVLLLGLLPSTMLAQEESRASTLSNGWTQMYSGSSKDDILRKPANTRSSIQLYYDVGVDANVYERIPDSSEFILEGDLLGSVGIHNNDLTWDTLGAYPGMTGHLYTTVNDTTYAIPVQVGKAALGVYTVDTINPERVADNYIPYKNHYYTVNYVERGRTAYIIADDSIPLTIVEDSVESNNDNVSAVWVNDKLVKVSLDENFSGSANARVTISFNDGIANQTREFEFCFAGNNSDPGNNGGNTRPPQGGDKTPEGMGDLVREEHTVETDEKHVFPAPFKPHDTAYFMVGDTKVYMVPAFSFGNFSETFGESFSNGMALKDGEYDYTRLSPTFFVAQDDNNYGKVTKPELLTEIKKAVTSYSIDVDVVVGHPHFSCPATFPASYHYTADTSFTGYVYQMGHAHRGIYVATLTATVNEQELTSQTRLEWMPSRQLWYTATSNDPIDEVNDFLYAQEYDANCSIMINLPAGEYEGFLETPAHLIDSNVFFYGETDEDGRPTTVITGGLIGSGIPRDIHFKGNHTWVDGVLVIANEWGNGMPNQASLGKYNYVDFRNCILEGYNCALRTEGGNVKGADSCTFRNNNTAVFIKTDKTGITYQYNNFIRNVTAFQVEKLGEGANLSNMKLTGSAFIDNGKDVVSKLSQNIFMPGAFCGYTTEGDTVVPRECITESASPNGVGKKQVFVYPQAASLDEYTMVDGVRTFTSFIYDTAFYKSNISDNGSNNKGPMISRNLAATFPLPYSELAGNTFRVMDENTGKIMKVTFPALGGNS